MLVLNRGGWYGMTMWHDTWHDTHYSPIRIADVVPKKLGNGSLTIRFLHVNYPAGVQDKEYALSVLLRTPTHLIARNNEAERTLCLEQLTKKWMMHHFEEFTSERQFDEAGEVVTSEIINLVSSAY